ncbi:MULTISPECIES: YncE family protein [unclassified Streptomyces]|uniref:YncE family protein n=1 Tax=unclassified Streptomyces TaxID=2593676 RepID=UPI0035E1529D
MRPHDASAPPLVVTPGQLPESSCLSRDTKTLFVGARRSSSLVAVDARTMKVQRSRRMGGDPLRVYAVDEDRLLVTDIVVNTFTLYSTALRPIRMLQLDSIPAAASFHPSRAAGLVSQLATNSVAVVDMERFALVGGFDTGLEPDSSILLPTAQ